MIIIITDGQSTFDKDQTIPEARLARQSGVVMYSIGITNAIDEVELRQMSSEPQEKGKNYWTEEAFTNLDTIVNSLVEQTCLMRTNGKNKTLRSSYSKTCMV